MPTDPEALVMRKLLLSGLTQVTSSRIRTLGHNVKELQVRGWLKAAFSLPRDNNLIFFLPANF